MARVEPVLSSRSGEIENPYKSSHSQLIESDAAPLSTPRIFDFSGRISLSRYWLFHLPFVLVVPTVLLVFFMVGLRHQPMVLFIAVATIVIPSGLLSVSLLMRRARDLGWSPAWGLISMFVPFIGFLVMLPLVTFPGQKMANKYGPPNRPLSMPGQVMVCVLIALAFIGSFGLLAYSPDFSWPVIGDWLANSFNGSKQVE